MHDKDKTLVISDTRQLASPATRRGFLRALGLGGTVVLLPSAFAACRESTAPNADQAITDAYLTSQAVTIDLSSDIGIFRFALVLEQLEQAFYNQLTQLSTFSSLFPAAADQEAIIDIRNDENIHRTFIDAALGSQRLPQLSFNFGAAFSSRSSVLGAARTFANVGVAAYNGAGRYLKAAENLLVAGKIVSVEARHTATLLDLDDAGNATGAGEASGVRFADLTQLTTFGADNASALDNILPATQVGALAQPFVVQRVNLTNAPSTI